MILYSISWNTPHHCGKGQYLSSLLLNIHLHRTDRQERNLEYCVISSVLSREEIEARHGSESWQTFSGSFRVGIREIQIQGHGKNGQHHGTKHVHFTRSDSAHNGQSWHCSDGYKNYIYIARMRRINFPRFKPTDAAVTHLMCVH